jgi:Uncharacterized conserved protein
MNTFLPKALGVLALSTLSLSAFASTYAGSCTTEAKSNWMTPAAVQAKFEQQGYAVRRIKSSGTCYEVYAKDKDGQKVELFVSPANAAVVGQAGK